SPVSRRAITTPSCADADPRGGARRPPGPARALRRPGLAPRRDREVGRDDPEGRPPPQRRRRPPAAVRPFFPQGLLLLRGVAAPDAVHRLAGGPRVPQPAPARRVGLLGAEAGGLGAGADARIRERLLRDDGGDRESRPGVDLPLRSRQGAVPV